MAIYSRILSPLDQVMPRTYTRVFLVFACENHEAAINALRSGLQKTLTDLPYLKGSIATAPDAGKRLAIAWPGGGDHSSELLRELPAPAGFPSFAELQSSRCPLSLFMAPLSPVPVMPDHSPGSSPAPPAFAAAYTRLRGGLILCVCVHHMLMDGTGVGELVQLWARNSTSPQDPESHWQRPWANEPVMRCESLRAAVSSASGDIERLTQTELLQRHPEYNLLSLKMAEPVVVSAETPKFTSKMFAFPIGKLNAAKDQLKPVPGLASLTVNSILSAIIWSCITHVRATRLQPRSDQQVKLGFAVNGRKQLGEHFVHPPYLGNVNLFGLANVSVSELELASQCKAGQSLEHLVPVVASITEAISRISVAHIAEAISFVEKTPDVTDVIPGWSSKDALDLSMTSWANQPLYSCHFGDAVGKPEFVRVPFAEFDGLVTILPRQREAKDMEMIDAVVFLRMDDINALENYEPWASWT